MGGYLGTSGYTDCKLEFERELASPTGQENIRSMHRALQDLDDLANRCRKRARAHVVRAFVASQPV